MSNPTRAVRILGSAGWMPQPARETCAYLIRDDDAALLLDAGTGVSRLIASPSAFSTPTQLDIVLTHFHLDHVVGLSFLFALPEACTIRVWGPGAWLYGTPTARILDALCSPPYFGARLHQRMQIRDLSPKGLALERFSLAFRAQHLHSEPSLGIRVDDSLAYITDTEADPETAPFVRGCAALFHDAWTPTGFPTGHTSADRAAAIADAAGVASLRLIHLSPTQDLVALQACARRVFPESTLASDGTSIPL